MKEELEIMANTVRSKIHSSGRIDEDLAIRIYGLLLEAASSIESLEKEMQEQCRIIGMSAERELSLIAKIESLEKDAARYRWIKVQNDFFLTDEKMTIFYGNESYKTTHYMTSGGVNLSCFKTLDEDIDTAMQSANKGE